jgi:hypothetical protein
VFRVPTLLPGIGAEEAAAAEVHPSVTVAFPHSPEETWVTRLVITFEKFARLMSHSLHDAYDTPSSS